MATIKRRLDDAYRRLTGFRHAIEDKLIYVKPALDEVEPDFWIPNPDPTSAYSLKLGLESAVKDPAAEGVWEDLTRRVVESEKLPVRQRNAFLKTIFLGAGLHFNRACQHETALECAERLFLFDTAHAHLLTSFVYRYQGKYKAAIDQALIAFDTLFDTPPDKQGIFLACHAASEIGYMLQTMTEHQPQRDLRQSFDPWSVNGTVIQAAEWTTEAFVCHKMFFPEAIELSQYFEARAFDATLRLSVVYSLQNVLWRSTDRPLERLMAVLGQLLLNSPWKCFSLVSRLFRHFMG